MNDEDRRDALDVLGDALLWQLAAARWRQVDDAVRAMAKALARDDEEAFRRAVSDLEMAGPVRGVGAEQPAADPETESVRERINEMVHTLTGAVRPQPDGPAPAG